MITMLCLVATLAASPAQVPQTTGAQPPSAPQSRTPPRDPATEKKGTAVIKGKITAADSGRPLRRAQIRLTAPELPQARTTSTNPQGGYEFRDLPPGRYTVTVSRSGHLSLQYGQRRPGEPPKPLQIAEGQAVEKLDFALPKAGVISGRITDETGDSYANVAVYAMQVQFFQGRRMLVPVSSGGNRADDTGQFRLIGLPPGDYVVMAQTQETWTVEGETRRVFSYAPSYFGGTANAADAQRVKVGLGAEVGAVDITMLAMPASTVSGTAIGSDGAPLAGGNVSLGVEVVGPNGGSYSGGAGTTIGPDGSWRLTDVSPGEFRLTARSVGRDKPMETAEMMLVVQGDIEGIVLTADNGGTLTGRVVTDDGSPLPEARGLRLSAQSLAIGGRRAAPTLLGDDNGVVRSDGAFTLKGVAGPSLLRLGPLPRGWVTRQIAVDDKDYVDAPIELRGAREVAGVRIVITNHFPVVTGQITDDKGIPAEGTVLLFPSDAAKWMEAAGTLRTSRPDQSGVFRFDTVRPGEYLAIALDYVQQWQVNDPEFLETLRDRATTVKVEEGANQQLALKLK